MTIIDLKKNELRCHEFARAAYEAGSAITLQYDPRSFPKRVIQSNLLLEPIHAVKNQNGEFEFFAGWFWLQYSYHCEEPKAKIITHNNICDEEIMELASAYLVGSLFKSPNRKYILSDFCTSIASLPIQIRKRLFGNLHSISTLVTCQNFSSETEAAIRHQINSNKSEPYTSIFSTLIDPKRYR